MKALQTMTNPKSITGKLVVKEEKLASGESITKAITMSARKCCGSGYIEKASA